MSSEAGAVAAAGRSPWVTVGNFFFKYRDFLFPAVFLVLVAFSDPMPLGSRGAELGVDLLGIAVALSGQVLRAVVIGLAYIRRGGLNKQVYADRLVTEGVFAHSRNPLYLGNFLALLGFTIIHHSVLCYAVGIPFFAFAYLAIVAAEEDFLGQKFGAEYEAYRERTNRFFPRLKGLGATLRSMRFDWKRLLRKEYGSTFAGLSMIAALLVWDEYAREGEVIAQVLQPVLISWGVVVLGYLTARYLKKSGSLGTG